MFASKVIFAASVLLSSVLAAPIETDLTKRGGYYKSDGSWVDDGYYCWSRGPKTSPFVPWADTDCSKSSSSGDGSGKQYESNGSYSGQATWYMQGGNAGACGSVASDSDYVVALDPSMYQGGAYCGRTITVRNGNTGATSQATVRDLCPSCGSGSIDLSYALFGSLADHSQGVFPVTWWFN